MESGNFRDRIQLQTRTATHNSTGKSEVWANQGQEEWASVLIVNRSRAVDYQQTYSAQKMYKVTLRGKSNLDVKDCRFLWKSNNNIILEPYLVVYDASRSDSFFSIYYCHQVS